MTKAEQSDQIDVTDIEAAKLQRALRFSDEFFASEPDPVLLESELLFKAPKRTTKREKTYLAEFARIVQHLLGELDERHRLPAVQLPRLQGVPLDVVGAAFQARQALQVARDEPIRHLTHVVERAGAVVVVRPNGLSPEDEDRFDDGGGNRHSEVHHGYSTWVGPFRERPLVVMRASSSWERTRWTVGHELGHLLLHRVSVGQEAEEEASRFASELLAPSAVIASELQTPVTLAGLVPLKKKWGISIGALLPHLRFGELISATRYDALREQLYSRRNHETGRTWGLDEPGWDDRTPERPRLISAWSERVFRTSNALALRSILPFFPADLLDQALREQRSVSAVRKPLTRDEGLAPVTNLMQKRAQASLAEKV